MAPTTLESPVASNHRTNQRHTPMELSEASPLTAPAHNTSGNPRRRHLQRLLKTKHRTQVPPSNRRLHQNKRKVTCRRKPFGVWLERARINRCLTSTAATPTRTRWSCCLSISRCWRRPRWTHTWTTLEWKRQPEPMTWWWECVGIRTALAAVSVPTFLAKTGLNARLDALATTQLAKPWRVTRRRPWRITHN